MSKVIQGDCLVELKNLEDNSVDSIVTDPPYELGFMGKSWDNTGIANNPLMWAECLRVLKPGGYLLSFGGTRTYHRMACAIEDAGFEVRDMIEWVYGSGFPKSLNISLQIKKKYNIGLCTCNVFEPMIELEYENSNNKRDNISNGDNDGLGFGEQIQGKGTNDNEVAEQVRDTNLSSDSAFRKESGVCELSETDSQKEQGLKEVSESILQSGVCKSISENEGLGNTTIRTGVEKAQTTSEREGQGVSDMQNKNTDRVAGSSLDTIQNGGKELNGEPSWSLSELPQQDRENNRKRIGQIKNDCGTEEWNNLSRFICSKCYCIKKDIGGTALKPSHEPICLARKPLEKGLTIAENVLKYGTGGINIDGSRVETNPEVDDMLRSVERVKRISETWEKGSGFKNEANSLTGVPENGRFPANLILEDCEEVRECFPETKTGKAIRSNSGGKTFGGENTKPVMEDLGYDDNGGNASRFFKSIIYQAKASKSERNKGCEGLEEQTVNDGREKDIDNAFQRGITPRKNTHPTIKPLALMEYLIKMVTPKGGVILDPFAGSGSTLVAAKQNGFQYIGIEMTAEYIPIIEARLK